MAKEATEIALVDIKREMVIREVNGGRGWLKIRHIARPVGVEGVRTRQATVEYLTRTNSGIVDRIVLTECGTSFVRRPPFTGLRKRSEGGWHVIYSDRVIGHIVRSPYAREWFAFTGRWRIGRRHTKAAAAALLREFTRGRAVAEPC